MQKSFRRAHAHRRIEKVLRSNDVCCQVGSQRRPIRRARRAMVDHPHPAHRFSQRSCIAQVTANNLYL
jgi:hypothetical protein